MEQRGVAPWVIMRDHGGEALDTRSHFQFSSALLDDISSYQNNAVLELKGSFYNGMQLIQ